MQGRNKNVSMNFGSGNVVHGHHRILLMMPSYGEGLDEMSRKCLEIPVEFSKHFPTRRDVLFCFFFINTILSPSLNQIPFPNVAVMIWCGEIDTRRECQRND